MTFLFGCDSGTKIALVLIILCYKEVEMRKVINMGMTLIASLIVLLGLLFIILPGPAIIFLPLGIWLFNKYQPGKLDPFMKRFMRFNRRMADRLDRFFR